MPLSEQIKPISYLKANTSRIFKELRENTSPLIITQNGEAKAVLQDIREYEKNQETRALLKILAMGKKHIQEGRGEPVESVISRLHKELA